MEIFITICFIAVIWYFLLKMHRGVERVKSSGKHKIKTVEETFKLFKGKFPNFEKIGWDMILVSGQPSDIRYSFNNGKPSDVDINLYLENYVDDYPKVVEQLNLILKQTIESKEKPYGRMIYIKGWARKITIGVMFDLIFSKRALKHRLNEEMLCKFSLVTKDAINVKLTNKIHEDGTIEECGTEPAWAFALGHIQDPFDPIQKSESYEFMLRDDLYAIAALKEKELQDKLDAL